MAEERKSEYIETRLSYMDRRFDEIGNRFDDYAKRFDDVEWYVTGLMGIVSVIVAAVVLAAGWNYNTERNNLREFEKQVKDEILNSSESKLGLYGEDGTDLSGQTVKVENVYKQLGDAEDVWRLLFYFARASDPDRSHQ
jgi:hypothetical protein